MNNVSIFKNIFRNGFVAGVTFILTTLMSFIVRTVFIRILGEKYLGLNGVFTSLIQALSLTDLGMEAAFSFVLYRPIAKNNKEDIVKIIRTFKKVYEVVGIIILTFGLIIIPFLPVIIGEQGRSLDHVLLIYLLFLANSVGSYFFTYNRTLLNADQRNYVITTINFSVNLVGNSLQILSLIVFKSPIVFALIMFLTTMASNLLINLRVKKYYPFVFENYKNKDLRISRNTKITLIKNAIGGLSNKIGSMVVFASDNILISIFVNLSTVGMYANYTMITNNISGLVNRIIQPITSSIGRMKENSIDELIAFYHKFNFIVYSVPLFIGPQLFILLNPFIRFWLGDRFLLSQEIVFLIVFNLTLQIFRLPSLTFIDAFGLQWIQKWKSIFESFFNILISLVLLWAFHEGLKGVLLGTICSTLITVSWYEPYIVLKHAVRDLKWKYLFDYLKGLLQFGIATWLSWLVTYNFSGRGLFYLFELLIIVFLISVVVFIVFNSRVIGVLRKNEI